MQGRGVEVHRGPRGRDPWVHVGGHHHPPGVEAQHLGVVWVEGALWVGGWSVHRLPVLHLVQLLLTGERGPVRQGPRQRRRPTARARCSSSPSGGTESPPEQKAKREGRLRCITASGPWSRSQNPGDSHAVIWTRAQCPLAIGRTGFPLRSHTLLEAARAAPGTSPARNHHGRQSSDQESCPCVKEPGPQPAAGLGSPGSSGTQGPLGSVARGTQSSPSPYRRLGLHPQ